MKRKIFFILGFTLLFCLACVFAACSGSGDNAEHKHNYIEITTPPTCTEQGYTTYICTSCGDTYVDNYTDKIAHDYEWTRTKEPTETEKGVETGVCSRCNGTITRDIPELNHEHNYVETVVEPTCTTGGYTLYKCACEYEYTDNETPALGHNFGEWVITKEPTCTGTGIETRICSRDETHTETREVPATDVHNYVNGVCSVCGKIEVLSVTFYLEDGETVYYSITVNSGESVLLPTEEPKDAERRKEFKGWGKKEGDVFSETAYEFADGGTMLADVRENMEFRALFGENIYTPICP